MTRAAKSLSEALIALRLSPLMAVLLCGLALLVLGAASFAVRAAVEPVATAAAPKSEWRLPKPVVGAASRMKPASADVQTLARPIFSRSRRPQAPQANVQQAAKTPPSPPPVGLSIRAIAGTRLDARAFVASRSFPDGKWHRVGEQIEGWTISDMQGSELTLTNGARSFRLQLYPDAVR